MVTGTVGIIVAGSVDTGTLGVDNKGEVAVDVTTVVIAVVGILVVTVAVVGFVTYALFPIRGF